MLLLFPVVFLVGCSDIGISDDWPGGQVIQLITLTTNQSVSQIEAALEDIDYIEDVRRHTSGDIEVILLFDNAEDFFRFNDIIFPSREAVFKVVRTTFLVEQTITIQNPIYRFDNLIGASKVADKAGETSFTVDVYYAFLTRVRLTSSNSSRTERYQGYWAHFFTLDDAEDTEYVVLFLRTANTPIWYGIGVIATFIFMLGLWLVLGRGQNNAGQSQPFGESEESSSSPRTSFD